MVATRHVLSQGPMLRSLGRTALQALTQRLRSADAVPPCPGPWLDTEVEPPPAALVSDFTRAMGGDPAALQGRLPPHLFPQWGLPMAARALEGLPFPMLRVMNAGCTLRVQRAVPHGERLLVRARLESVDVRDSRAILCTRIVTGTRSAPDALDATLQAFVPLGRRKGAKKEPARVPADAREIDRVSLGARAGLDFAKLTGDFNPIHWLTPYARLSGFRGAILHGFGTFARAFEAVARAEGGDPYALACVEARFTKPLVLPAHASVFTSAQRQLFVGAAPGAETYLTGSYGL